MEFLTGKEIIAIALLLIIGAIIYTYIEHKNSYVTATIDDNFSVFVIDAPVVIENGVHNIKCTTEEQCNRIYEGLKRQGFEEVKNISETE